MIELPDYLDPAVVIAPGIRAELDQTPEWWDRQYRALERKQIPRDAASHDGHRIEGIRTYASTTTRRVCTDCQVELDPYQEGHSACAHDGLVDFHANYWVCRACGHREETPHA
ncbi:hypothetical protein ABS642_00855 [Microbacterium sp. A8/3-1]|uniref:Uncharacterized protein n=1 Tax=Microbacterium sp. A8/3-1 TaxID=3160749 RepID=A0AAU7VY58_9MICO